MLKSCCDDFRVTEIPAYEASGSGEHLFLLIRKQDVSAAELLKVVSHQLRISQRDIGVAGQKDRRAVTTQYVSVPLRCEGRITAFHDDRIQVLEVTRHENKLRTGHLLGNRFEIVLRPTSDAFNEDHLAAVQTSLITCESNGFPNYYGIQRFGKDGHSLFKGLQLVRGTAADRRAMKVSRFERKMLLSAVQAAVFNILTAKRVSNETLLQPNDGDVVCRRDGIRPFLFSNRNTDSVDQLIPMGPIFGGKMLPAEGSVRELELNVLRSLELNEEHFASRKDTPGTRRPMVAWPRHSGCELCQDGSLVFRFELPAGSYATVLLAELVEQIVEPD